MSFETPQNLAPAPAQPEAAFIFDHLPKTGGTALQLVFEQIFGAEQVSPPVLGRTERWAEKNFSRYRMIVGHFHHPVPLAGRSERRVRLTILRDPLDRAVSEYFFFRNDVEKLPWHKLAVYAKDHDLHGYLKLLEAEGDVAVSNRYAHHFAAQLSRAPWRESKLLAQAKEAIADYDFVGIQEQLTDSVDLFCSTYGLPEVTDIPRANVTSGRVASSEIPVEARDRLIRLNRVDLELYEFARSRFQAWKRAIFRKSAGLGELDEMSPASRPSSAEIALKRSLNAPKSFGDQAVEICEVRVSRQASGNGPARSGELLDICLTIAAHIDVSDLTIGIQIIDDVGEIVFGTNTQLLGERYSVTNGMGYDVTFVLKADIRHGRYFVTAGLHTGATHADRCFHWREKAASFDVVDGANGNFVGYCRLETKVGWSELLPLRKFKLF